MRRILLLTFLLLVLASSIFGQNTTVSGTVTDTPDSQTWNNGTVTATFTPSQNYPAFPSYTWTGGTLNPTVTTTLSGTGTYSFSVPSTTAITPGGSTWSFKFCPQATAPCFTVSNVTISGGTQTLNAAPPSIRINLATATPPITAYADGELTGAVIGSTYYNLASTVSRVCQAVSGNGCNTWAVSGGNGLPTGPTSPNGVTFPLTCTVSGGVCGAATYSFPGVTLTSKSGGYTLAAVDRSTCLEINDAGAQTYILPDVGGTGFQFGYQGCILNLGAGTNTINNTSSSKFNMFGALTGNQLTTFNLTTRQTAYFYSSPSNNWDVLVSSQAISVLETGSSNNSQTYAASTNFLMNSDIAGNVSSGATCSTPVALNFNYFWVSPVSGTITGFFATAFVSTPAGSAGSVTYTLCKSSGGGAGAATAMTMTQDWHSSSAPLTASDTAHTVSVTAGDVFTVQISTPAFGTSAAGVRVHTSVKIAGAN